MKHVRFAFILGFADRILDQIFIFYSLPEFGWRPLGDLNHNSFFSGICLRGKMGQGIKSDDNLVIWNQTHTPTKPHPSTPDPARRHVSTHSKRHRTE